MTLEWWNSGVKSIENLKKIAQKIHEYLLKKQIKLIILKILTRKKYLEALIFVNWRLFVVKILIVEIRKNEKWMAEFFKNSKN